jgi:DNA-binding NarL/FixJ family response regulator
MLIALLLPHSSRWRPDESNQMSRAMREESPSPPTGAKRRILIVDDHPLVRRGLTALINAEPDLTVCAEAATPQEGLDAIASSKPDLVIADLSFQDGDGLDLIRDICSSYAGLPVLALTMYDASLYVRRAFEAGARGYVTKQEMTEALLTAIRCVLSGGEYLTSAPETGLDI